MLAFLLVAVGAVIVLKLALIILRRMWECD